MEASYILGCAVELGEITPLEAATFYCDAPPARALNHYLDARLAFPPHFLRNTAREFLSQLSKQEQMVWALRGLHNAPAALQFLQERIEFAIQRQVAVDLQGADPFRGLPLEELTTSAATQAPVFSTVDDVSQPTVARFVAAHYGPVLQQLVEDLEQAEAALAWLGQPGARQRAREIAAHFFENPVLPAVNAARKAKAQQQAHKARHRARSAIKKATALLTRFGRQKDLQMLVSGHRVELSHPASPFKFELVPFHGGWLESKTLQPGGTTPFELHVLTKENVALSRLCVLFKDTPVLDQLLALTLYVDTGNELELLEKANWFGIKDAEQVRGILAEKAPSLLGKVPALRDPEWQPNPEGLEGFLPRNPMWQALQGPVRHWVAECLADVRTRTLALSGVPLAHALPV